VHCCDRLSFCGVLFLSLVARSFLLAAYWEHVLVCRDSLVSVLLFLCLGFSAGLLLWRCCSAGLVCVLEGYRLEDKRRTGRHVRFFVLSCRFVLVGEGPRCCKGVESSLFCLPFGLTSRADVDFCRTVCCILRGRSQRCYRLVRHLPNGQRV
jgi:hypothetical protein